MAAEDERGVCAPETEGVSHGILHRDGLPFVSHKAKAASLINILQIGHRRSHLIAQRQYRDSSLQAAGAAEKMAGHRLGRTDQQALRGITKGLADGTGLGPVA